VKNSYQKLPSKTCLKLFTATEQVTNECGQSVQNNSHLGFQVCWARRPYYSN